MKSDFPVNQLEDWYMLQKTKIAPPDQYYCPVCKRVSFDLPESRLLKVAEPDDSVGLYCTEVCFAELIRKSLPKLIKVEKEDGIRKDN